MKIIELVDKKIEELPILNDFWTLLRPWPLYKKYRKRREYYEALVSKENIIYREDDVIIDIQNRILKRGYTPILREMGNIHTFAFIPDRGWHRHLLPDLKDLGPTTWFDCRLQDSHACGLIKESSSIIARRKEINDRVLPAIIKAHAERSVDWVFIYASGKEISANTIRQIRDELGIPTVNMCLDDKQSWIGKWMGDHRAGQIDIAAEFDISWTSARVACEWYLAEGARPLYMPEGCDIYTYKPMAVKQDIPLSFVGGAYGFRPSVVRYLNQYNVPVQVFGSGWNNSEWVENVVQVFNRSRINLGMGGIQYSEALTNIKGRDFEIPGTGGGLYLTSFNPDLAQHFTIGEEIVCYCNKDEMLELIRYYLSHPEEARKIATRGRKRCLKEHRWLHRYETICRILGILA